MWQFRVRLRPLIFMCKQSDYANQRRWEASLSTRGGNVACSLRERFVFPMTLWYRATKQYWASINVYRIDKMLIEMSRRQT